MTTNNCVGDYKSSKLSDNLNKIVCCECFKEYERVEIFLCHWQNYHQNLCFPSAYTKTNVNTDSVKNDVHTESIESNISTSNILEHRRKHTINVKQNVKDHDHECIECKKWFSSIGSLYHHFKNIHPHLQVPKHMQPITIQMLMKGFNSNKCLRCKLSFKTHFSIQKHFQKNHSTRIYLCPECNRGCLYERSIKKHWLKMHKRKSFPVQNISEPKSTNCAVINTVASLKNRTQSANWLNLKCCTICNMTLDTHFHASQHYESVHSLKLIICPEGCKGFRTYTDLIAHWFKIHTNLQLPKTEASDDEKKEIYQSSEEESDASDDKINPDDLPNVTVSLMKIHAIEQLLALEQKTVKINQVNDNNELSFDFCTESFEHHLSDCFEISDDDDVQFVQEFPAAKSRQDTTNRYIKSEFIDKTQAVFIKKEHNYA